MYAWATRRTQGSYAGPGSASWEIRHLAAFPVLLAWSSLIVRVDAASRPARPAIRSAAQVGSPRARLMRLHYDPSRKGKPLVFPGCFGALSTAAPN